MIMNEEPEAILEENFRQLPWYGAVAVEQAIEAAKWYRNQLCVEERRLYDEQLRLGRHPSAAAETVEIASGRLKPHGTEVQLETAKAA